MANLKEILAQNLKENKRGLGITQPELAERAGLSTHYLGMIEKTRNFPTADASSIKYFAPCSCWFVVKYYSFLIFMVKIYICD